MTWNRSNSLCWRELFAFIIPNQEKFVVQGAVSKLKKACIQNRKQLFKSSQDDCNQVCRSNVQVALNSIESVLPFFIL